MAMLLSGRLTWAAGGQPAFRGCRVIALFDQKRSSDSAAPSAVSDTAGDFTLTCPDRQELTSETVTFIALSPTARFIGETEVMTADLGDGRTIEIEVERFDPPPADPVPPAVVPERAAVDSLFRTDAAVRAALTANLKPLRAGSDAIATRVQAAFENFHPTPLSAEELAARHFVARGTDPGKVLDQVIADGVNALGTAGTEHTLILRKSDELAGLMTEGAGDEARHVDLLKLVSFINGKSPGGSLLNEPAVTRCRAELEAEAIMAGLKPAPPGADGGGGGGGGGGAARPGASGRVREAEQFVKDAVNIQMRSATSPETRLDYGSMPGIPNSADSDQVQSRLLQTFELRPGASDVTSYHDFYTLQIAFQHVWTQIFDGQLESLGRELYGEYVKLKDFSGSADPDPGISTIDDLRQLMDEVRKLSQIVQDDIPSDLADPAAQAGTKSSGELSDTAKVGIAVATGGVSWLLDRALEEFSKMGRKPVIGWDDFPGPWPPRQDKIYLTLADGVVPAGSVEVVLKTDYASHIKIIEFEPWDPDAGQFVHGPQISNTGHVDSVTMPLRTSQIASGVLEFASEESTGLNLGRYLLGNLTEKLKDGTRVTFYWKDS